MENHHLSKGTTEGAIAIISDVDMLFDYFMGDAERGAGRDNNNVDFILNLAESLAGDDDLLQIRGRDSTDRSFTVINDIRTAAAKRAEKPNKDIEDAIEKANRQLEEGQERKNMGGITFLSQSQASIEKVQKIQGEIRDLYREKDKISRRQRDEIGAAINRYKWSNMLLMPTLIIITGLVVGLIRKLKTAAK